MHAVKTEDAAQTMTYSCLLHSCILISACSQTFEPYTHNICSSEVYSCKKDHGTASFSIVSMTYLKSDVIVRYLCLHRALVGVTGAMSKLQL